MATSSSQASLLKEQEIENTADFIFDLSRNVASRRMFCLYIFLQHRYVRYFCCLYIFYVFCVILSSDSEVPVISRNTEVSVGHPDSEASHDPSDLGTSSRLLESEIPVKRISIASAMKDQAERKTIEVYSYIKHYISLFM